MRPIWLTMLLLAATTACGDETTMTPPTSGAGGQGLGGTTGAGGDGGTWMPPDGEPIDAPDLTWTWIDFPEAKCRDGSSTGIGVNFNSASKRLMIYLEGGGACFDPGTCSANPSHADGAGFSGKNGGVFDRDNTANPVADYNFVYVPYCTGDVHAGDNPDGNVPGVGPQVFVGYANIRHYLDRLVPTFLDADHVLLTGVSAGGFGAAATAQLVQRTFGPVPVWMIDDSGPPMSATYLEPCIQETWRELWGLGTTLLSDCGDDCPDVNDYALPFAKHLATAYPGGRFALIQARRDTVVRAFFGQGENDCTGFLPMAATKFEAGLDEMVGQLQGYDNFGGYQIDATSHTYLGGGSFYTTTVDGVALSSWVASFLAGNLSFVGP
jgi:hypothetical protein